MAGNHSITRRSGGGPGGIGRFLYGGILRLALGAVIALAAVGCYDGAKKGIESLLIARATGTDSQDILVKAEPRSLVFIDPSGGVIETTPDLIDEAWRVFEGGAEKGFVSEAVVRMRCDLMSGFNIRRVKVRGTATSGMAAWALSRGSRTRIHWFGGDDFVPGGEWRAYEGEAAIRTEAVEFEIPPGEEGEALRGIELWGTWEDDPESRGAIESLKGIASPDELEQGLASIPVRTKETRALPAEASFSRNDGEGESPARFTLTLERRPQFVRRAYLRYEGMNSFRPMSVERRINGGEWIGGHDLSGDIEGEGEWRDHVEEINPRLLSAGENVIEFRTERDDVGIRGLRLITEGDGGWDHVASCAPAAACEDGPGTPPGPAPQWIEIELERTAEPDALLCFASGTAGSGIVVETLRECAWRAYSGGEDFGKLVPGWNLLRLPGAGPADGIRIGTSAPGGGGGTAISRIRMSASPLASGPNETRVVVTYPRNGEYFGRKACVEGFVAPARNAAGLISLSLGTRATDALTSDLTFSLSFTKEEAGFGDQGDDEEWAPVLIARDHLTYGAAAVPLSLNLLAPGDDGSASGGGAGGGDPGDDGGDGEDAGGYSFTVGPDASKTVDFGPIRIEIPAGAVDENTVITVIPLTGPEVAPLNEGMVNVTAPAAGYRFLVNGKPHGSFKKPIRISFTYGVDRLPPGHGDADVSMFFYDEGGKRWSRLRRVDSAASEGGSAPSQSVISPDGDAAASTDRVPVTSETDHFTDIINATLTAPEHPDPLAYNPNSIKDIKAGDPAAGVNLIETPQANPNGDAFLSYPIEVPRGRNGMQPRLEIRYSSSGGNGWLGQGWDLPVPSVTIDTKFGVPRYNDSDTYLLEGAELVEESPGLYRQRTEGPFKRIRRHGNSYADYWWEVTDRSGTVYVYGMTSQARLSGNAFLRGGAIFQWCLEKVIDPNGNAMTYAYDIESSHGGVQIYLREIAYTGKAPGASPGAAIDGGAYTVTFNRSCGTETRQDILTSGRSGFMTVNSCRLDSIEVKYNNVRLVRRYDLTYCENAPFKKTLLEKIQQYGADGTTLFNEHTMEYYDDLGMTDNPSYITGFGSGQSRGAFRTLIHLILFPVFNSALSSAIGNTISAYADLSVTPFSIGKWFSVGAKGGGNFEFGETINSFVDVNGDGLPDQVFLGSYKPNLGVSEEGVWLGFGPSMPLPGISTHGRDMTMSFNVGPTINIALSAFLDQSWSFSNTLGYWRDVNGDGRVDFVNGGMVRYNHDVGGMPVFLPTVPRYDSPVEFEEDGLDPNVRLEQLDLGTMPLKSEQAKKYYRDDPIRMWRAPWRGLVRVTGEVILGDYKPEPGPREYDFELGDYENGDDGGEVAPPEKITIEKNVPEYLTDDGVRASIYHGSRLLWSEDIPRGHFEPVRPWGVDDIWVEQGDELYFRVNSIDDGAYDIVHWDPEIEYLGVDADLTDENGLSVYRYCASEDFNLAQDALNPFTAPLSGEVLLSGSLMKHSATSDDITATVLVLDPDGLEKMRLERTIPGDFIGEEDLGLPASLSLEKNESVSSPPAGQIADRVYCILRSDTPIDWNAVSWKPELTYTSIELTYTDENGEEKPVPLDGTRVFQHSLPVTTALYPLHDREPVAPFEVPDGFDTGGQARIIFEAAPLSSPPDDYEARVTLAVKQGGRLVAKESAVVSRSHMMPIILDHVMDLDSGDALHFVFASDRHDISRYLQIGVPEVYYQSENFSLDTVDPSTAHYTDAMVYRGRGRTPSFGGGYRSWYYGRWNGENDAIVPEYLKPLDEQDGIAMPNLGSDSEEELLAKTNAINERVRMFSSMVPDLLPIRKDENNEITPPHTLPIPDGDRGMWFGHDRDCWISPGKMSASRVIRKYIPDGPEVDDPDNPGQKKAKITLAATGMGQVNGIGVPLFTRSEHRGLGASCAGTGLSTTEGNSHTMIGYFDLNGDGYPDIVNSFVNFITDKRGMMGGVGLGSIGSDVKATRSENENLSMANPMNCIESMEAILVETDVRGSGDVKGQSNNGGSTGVSGSGGFGRTHTSYDYIDVNGDGLPDRVVSALEGQPTFVVYNMGYCFNGGGVWDLQHFQLEKTATVGAGGGGSYSSDKTGVGGGVSVTYSQAATEATYIDLNGDGLPDRLYKRLSDKNSLHIPKGIVPLGPLVVQYNTGTGFMNGSTCFVGGDHNEPIMFNETVYQSPTGYFSIKIPILFIAIIINPGMSGGRKMQKTDVMMVDVDGDGLPDHVKSGAGGISVRFNRTGRTNLLKSVTRPLGGKIAIEYERRGNTVKMPQSRWVMTRVETTDGMETLDAGSGSVHRYASSFEYEEGRYHRGEREFLGFGRVTETRADGSVVEREFHNESLYLKGLEKKSSLRDADGDLWTVKRSTHETRPVLPEGHPMRGHAAFPALTRVETLYYEGETQDDGSPGKSSLLTYDYDAYGNVTRFVDYGDASSLDDVQALIAYAYRAEPYIMDRPSLIRVTDSSGNVLRRRVGAWDARGNLRELREFLDDATAAVTTLLYDDFGNLSSFTGPENAKGQRYSVTYTYDPAVNTHITGIRDSFGYASSAQYEYLFGNPLMTLDVNRNAFAYSYDRFGRVTRIVGPNDSGSDRPTVAFYYGAPVAGPNGELTAPAYARTMNRVSPTMSRTLDTVVTADGLKRTIQTKKSAEVNHILGMTISGPVVHDAMGRPVREGQPVFVPSPSSEYAAAEMRNPTRYEYDVMGRKTLIRHPDASTVAMTHGFDGGWFLTETRDQEGKLRRMRRDVRGNITSVRELCGGRWNATSYIYTPLGEIATIIDDGGNATQVRYDSLGRRTAIDNPDAGLVEYLYDRAGNVTRKITPNLRAAGKSIRYYHSFTRLDRIDYPDMADTTYTYGPPGAPYNRAGRVAAVDNGSVKEERFYGRLGEVTRSVRTVKVTKPSPATKSVSMSYAYNNLGQMENVTFPDGETIIYAYDYGGRLLAVSGSKGGMFERYVRDIAYDEFGSRTRVRYGNDAASEYEYDPLTRRLTRLVTTAGGKTVQNLEYEYDRAGNILSKTNRGFFSAGGEETTSEQTYGYDDLHRLISSEGEYRDPKGVNTYTNDFTYDTIGNILTKAQVNDFDPAEGPSAPVPGTTYTFNYSYSTKPHAVVSTGDTTYTYDASGNMTAMKGPAVDRTISWDEENRITKTLDRRDETVYAYDDGGTRAIKRGRYGETFYAGENLSIRNGTIESKHIFAGNARVVTKVANKGKDAGTYYYHGDHLGSSNSITTKAGTVHENLEYFPYGETWVHASAPLSNLSLPFKFTGKEYDPETGWYYFGARYYDARLSRWTTIDPALGKYFPNPNDFDTEHDYFWYLEQDASAKLPGIGGVFNSINMDLYQYGGMNPMKYVDPDGKLLFRIPFTKDYFYLQQIPKNDGGGYRMGRTNESSGRYIDPTGHTGIRSLWADQKISFVNDERSKPSTDRKVSFKQAKAVEGVARKTGLLFNINSSVRGKGQGYHTTGDAVDINRIAADGDVSQFKDSTSESPSAVLKMYKKGEMGLIRDVVKAFDREGALQIIHPETKYRTDHKDHIHGGNINR